MAAETSGTAARLGVDARCEAVHGEAITVNGSEAVVVMSGCVASAEVKLSV